MILRHSVGFLVTHSMRSSGWWLSKGGPDLPREVVSEARSLLVKMTFVNCKPIYTIVRIVRYRTCEASSMDLP